MEVEWMERKSRKWLNDMKSEEEKIKTKGIIGSR